MIATVPAASVSSRISSVVILDASVMVGTGALGLPLPDEALLEVLLPDEQPVRKAVTIEIKKICDGF